MNGNDILEIIEQHSQQIEEDFFLEQTHEQLVNKITNNKTMDKILESDEYQTFANEWAELHMQQTIRGETKDYEEYIKLD